MYIRDSLNLTIIGVHGEGKGKGGFTRNDRPLIAKTAVARVGSRRTCESQSRRVALDTHDRSMEALGVKHGHIKAESGGLGCSNGKDAGEESDRASHC